MKTTTSPSNDWGPCESGLLTSIGKKVKAGRRRRMALRAGLSTAVLFVVIGVAVWRGRESDPAEENYFGGIACHEVAEQLNAYVAGTVSDDVRGRIEAHLQQCPRCQKAMRSMNATQAALWAPTLPIDCDCPDCRRLQVLAALHRVPANDAGLRVVSMDGVRSRAAY